jgi:hypothetical protein
MRKVVSSLWSVSLAAALVAGCGSGGSDRPLQLHRETIRRLDSGGGTSGAVSSARPDSSRAPEMGVISSAAPQANPWDSPDLRNDLPTPAPAVRERR